MPASVTDEDLRKVAVFRSRERIPVSYVNLLQLKLDLLACEMLIRRSLSNEDEDGGENFSYRAFSHYFKVYRSYLNCFSAVLVAILVVVA